MFVFRNRNFFIILADTTDNAVNFLLLKLKVLQTYFAEHVYTKLIGGTYWFTKTVFLLQ